jgi:hypothetical protein
VKILLIVRGNMPHHVDGESVVGPQNQDIADQGPNAFRHNEPNPNFTSGGTGREAGCAIWDSRRKPDPAIVTTMTNCAYCGEHATVAIPAIPSRVCITHALEFWTGLLTYVKDQTKLTEQHETSCICGMCDDKRYAESNPLHGALSRRLHLTWRDLQVQ